MDENEHIRQNIAKALTEGRTPCFLFERVSHERQEDGVSLDQQLQGGTAYAERQGLTVVYTYLIIESAYKENRKRFNAILDAAVRLGVKNLVFKNHDRLSRNINHTARYKELIERHNFCFHFYELNQQINKASSYDERWMFDFFVLIAQRHSQKLSHDVKGVHRHKAAKGVPPGLCWGYVTDKQLIMPAIDKAVEADVREAFRLYDEAGLSIAEVAAELNRRGIASPKGGRWAPGNMHFVLRSPYYAGRFLMGGQLYEGAYEPYISWADYEKRLARMSRHPGVRQSKRFFAYARLVRCATCGTLYNGEVKKEKFIYYGHRCREGGRIFITEDQLHDVIGRELAHYSVNVAEIGRLKQAVDAYVKDISGGRRQAVNALQKQITEVDGKIKKLYLLFADSSLPQEPLRDAVSELHARKEALQREYQASDIEDIDKLVRDAQGICDDIFYRIPEILLSKASQQRPHLDMMIKTIRLDTDSTASIEFKEPFSFLLRRFDSIEEAMEPLREHHAVRQNPIVLPRYDDFRTPIAALISYLLNSEAPVPAGACCQN